MLPPLPSLHRAGTRETVLLASGALLLAVVGIGFRFWHIGSTPMWLDEAYSAYAAAKGFAFLWQVVPAYETHPPVYYTLLRLWTLAVGDGLAAERALGLAAGVLTLPVVSWAAWAAGGWLGWDGQRRRRVAFVAFALACLSMPLVEMARQVRPYPVMILVYALALRALIAILARRASGRPLPGAAYAAYLLLLEAMLWLHNLGPLWAMALGLSLLLAFTAGTTRRTDWGWLIAGHAAVLLFYLPGLAILADQAPTWVRSTWLGFSPALLAEHLPMLYAVPGWQGLSALALAGLTAGLLLRDRRGWRLGTMLLLLAFLPTMLSILVSVLAAPVFITRTLTPAAVPAILLLAIGAAGQRGRSAWIAAGLTVVLAGNMAAVDVQARAGPPMQNWYAAIDWLKARRRPGDLILAYPNEGALPFDRASMDRGLAWRAIPVPVAVPALDQGGWNPTGSRGVVSLPRDRLESIAKDEAIRRAGTVWLLRLGAPAYDRGDMFLDALGRKRQATARFVDGAIDIIGLERR